MRKIIFVAVFSALLYTCDSAKKDSKVTQGLDLEEVDSLEKKVFFVSPKDGEVVSSPVAVQMGVQGMQVEPAGVSRDGFGHHHILVNMESWTVNDIIPMTDSTFHYGKGQTSASIELAPGEYTLSLQFADGVHASYGKALASSIKITVQ